MKTSGERLRAERIRLGLSQEAFAAHGGVKKLAQINYEQSKRSPDAEYLGRIATIGADVGYILTGQRLGVAEQAEARFVVHVEASRAARGEPAIGDVAEVIAGIADASRRKRERVDGMEQVNHYLSGLDDAGFAEAMEMLLHYGGMSSGNRNAVNQLVACLASSERRGK